LPAHQTDLQAIYYNTPAEKAQGLLFGFFGHRINKEKEFLCFQTVYILQKEW